MEKAEEDSVDIDEEEMSKWLNTSADDEDDEEEEKPAAPPPPEKPAAPPPPPPPPPPPVVTPKSPAKPKGAKGGKKAQPPAVPAPKPVPAAVAKPESPKAEPVKVASPKPAPVTAPVTAPKASEHVHTTSPPAQLLAPHQQPGASDAAEEEIVPATPPRVGGPSADVRVADPDEEPQLSPLEQVAAAVPKQILGAVWGGLSLFRPTGLEEDDEEDSSQGQGQGQAAAASPPAPPPAPPSAPEPAEAAGSSWWGGLTKLAQGAVADVAHLRSYITGVEGDGEGGASGSRGADQHEGEASGSYLGTHIPGAETEVGALGAPPLYDKEEKNVDVDLAEVAKSIFGGFAAIAATARTAAAQVKDLPSVRVLESVGYQVGREGLLKLGEAAGALRKALNDFTLSGPELFPGLDDEIVAGLERRDANFPSLFVRYGGAASLEKLEELANDSSRTVNRARSYLDNKDQSDLLELLGLLAPYFDVNASYEAAGEAYQGGQVPPSIHTVITEGAARLEAARLDTEAAAKTCVDQVKALIPAPEALAAPEAGEAAAVGSETPAGPSDAPDAQVAAQAPGSPKPAPGSPKPTPAEGEAPAGAAESSSEHVDPAPAHPEDVMVRPRGLRIGKDVILVRSLSRALKVVRLEALKALAEYSSVAIGVLLDSARKSIELSNEAPPHPSEATRPPGAASADCVALSLALRELAARAVGEVQDIGSRFVTALSKSMALINTDLLDRAAAAVAAAPEGDDKEDAREDLNALKEGLIETVVLLSDLLQRDGDAAQEQVSSAFRYLFSVVALGALDAQTKSVVFV